MITFEERYASGDIFLMEGALGERLKREYGLTFNGNVAMAGMVRREEGKRALAELWKGYLDIAEAQGLPMLVATPTRRANRANVAADGLDASIISQNVEFLRSLCVGRANPVFVGGLMGCRGDAYTGAGALGEEEALDFHSWQAGLLERAGVDYLYAGIMPSVAESAGMARAMEGTGLPYVISFMLRREGVLPDGATLNEAIRAVDASVKTGPVCYMVNCVHPDILRQALLNPLNRTESVRERFHGIQANASPLAPEELDGSCELMTSDADELADAMLALRDCVDLRILGGCCGTDASHIRALAIGVSRMRRDAAGCFSAES